jgi:hypothetical protein
MTIVRYLVKSVDEAIPFYAALGFEVIPAITSPEAAARVLAR